MNFDLQHFARNFRVFYSTLIQGHSRQFQLASEFKELLLKQVKLWTTITTINKSNQIKEQDKILYKLLNANESDLSFRLQILYHSPKLQTVLIYGYLYHLLQSNSNEAIDFLSKNIKREAISNNNQFSKDADKLKIMLAWDKIDNYLKSKMKIIKFDKLLSDIFKQFSNRFIQLVFRIIIDDKKISKDNLGYYLQNLSRQFSIGIQYYQIDQRQKIKLYMYGDNKKISMKIGYIIRQKVYLFTNNLPQVKQKSQYREKLKDKMDESSKKLSNLFKNNSKILLNQLKKLQNKNQIAIIDQQIKKQ